MERYLEDPGLFKTKEESKLGALEYILQFNGIPTFTEKCSMGEKIKSLSAARG